MVNTTQWFLKHRREHYAAHASEDEIALRLDAQLRDLWEMARASQQTVELYEKSILPQARQTFEADQKSLINNTVTFDRVIRDYRALLSLELGYHRALGQLATSLARIRQTVGVDVLPIPGSATAIAPLSISLDSACVAAENGNRSSAEFSHVPATQNAENNYHAPDTGGHCRYWV